MSRSWWPFRRRRSDTSKQSKVPKVPGKEDQRHDETRRIARHLAREAYFAQDESGPEVKPESAPPQEPTVTVYGSVVHVNFHCLQDLLREQMILRKDPVTRHVTRVARRFDRSDVFYTKDGKLIDDENPPDDPYPLVRRKLT